MNLRIHEFILKCFIQNCCVVSNLKRPMSGNDISWFWPLLHQPTATWNKNQLNKLFLILSLLMWAYTKRIKLISSNMFVLDNTNDKLSQLMTLTFLWSGPPLNNKWKFTFPSIWISHSETNFTVGSMNPPATFLFVHFLNRLGFPNSTYKRNWLRGGG